MNGLQLGPLVLSGERFAIIAGIFVFMIGSGLLASRHSERFNLWSTVVVFAGLAAARLGHVVGNWSYFSDDPLRILAVWQGGFQWIWVVPVLLVASVALLKTSQERAWAIAPAGVSAFVFTLIYQLASATEPMPAPHIALERLDGSAVTLSQVSNQPTVINLWASWCGPCRREMPALQQAERANPDVRFLMINQGEGREKVEDFLEGEGITLKHVLLDQGMEVQRYYRTVALPVTLFLNSDGTLRYAHVGEIAPEQIAIQIARLN